MSRSRQPPAIWTIEERDGLPGWRRWRMHLWRMYRLTRSERYIERETKRYARRSPHAR